MLGSLLGRSPCAEARCIPQAALFVVKRSIAEIRTKTSSSVSELRQSNVAVRTGSGHEAKSARHPPEVLPCCSGNGEADRARGAARLMWKDSRSWLSHAIEAEFEATARSVRITSTDAAAVDVLPCWRAPGRMAGLICPGPVALRYIDPVGHRDLLAACDASLGTESGFLNVIKLVKHLNQSWAGEYGAPPLTAFHIEALALAHCTRPFNLAEEVAEFLAVAAELVWTPLPDPLGVAGPIVALDAGLASALLTEAARSAEAALMTCDVQTADDILSSLYEPRAS